MDRRTAIALFAVLAAPGLLGAGKKDEKPTGSSAYIALNTLTATIQRTNGRRGVLTVQAGLDVPDARLRAKVESVLPRVRAVMVQTLQTYATGMSPGAPPNGDLLSQALQRETDRILGQKGAKVLLGTMLIN
ncbi:MULTISPECIES: hypothetical protein [Phenylobacterium]|uniref:Flagellar protein FliL n=1 Tax=Phenylobacterium koreense TaxID=266125 RepID=A0ABV2EII0_9CAUL